MDRETWKLMFGDTPMPGDVSTPDTTVQWSPNGVANLGPGVAAGENMAANPASWVQRGDYRVNNQTAEAQKLNNGAWENLGFSPYTNEALQNSYGFMKAPDGTDPSQYQSWALANGWKEPQRNAGMTLGEALLMMGGAAMGAGALNGLGGAGAASSGYPGFIDAVGSGVGAGESITGALGAAGAGSAPAGWTQEAWDGLNSLQYGGNSAGGGAMDFTDVLGDWPSYTGGDAGFGMNGVDPIDFANIQSGAAQGYSPSSIGNWIKNTLGIDPSSSSGQSLVKNLVGSGIGGSSLLGTALGGLLGSMNGSKQAGTTTVTQEPWTGQQPFLLDAFQKAKTASGGSPLQTQANTNYSSVLSGPTTNPMLGMDNPYLTSAINNANADVTRAFMPAVNQANRASGSFGNSGVSDTYGKNMADAYSRNATSMRMTDYTNQQNLQQQAVNNTLGFTSNANNFAAQPSQNYAQTVQGNYGGQTTTPYYNNPLSGIMGGAMVGNSIGSNLGF